MATKKVAKKVAPVKVEKKPTPSSYFLIVFQVEGREGYRAEFHSSIENFNKGFLSASNHPTISSKRIYVVDRKTGEVSESK